MLRVKLPPSCPGNQLLFGSIRIIGCLRRRRKTRKRSSAANSKQKVQYIADTGFIAGFWDPNDRIRSWARRIARDHPGPHLTCEAALVEACFLAGPRRVGRALAEGDYHIDFS